MFSGFIRILCEFRHSVRAISRNNTNIIQRFI
nr:MAG TPA: hypothetical protein [Caudoviricetes sp.]